MVKNYQALGEMKIVDDPFYQPSPEEERDFWAGRGNIDFFVIQKDPFEIEVIDSSGCAGGLQETCGIEWWLEDSIYIHKDPDIRLWEGVTYRIDGLTVDFTQGDGWTTDDDAEYYFDDIYPISGFWTWLPHKISMIWHRQVRCRIQALKAARAAGRKV